MEKKQVAIVHFNTPELTEACIMSIRKHGGRDYQITIFDNSDSGHECSTLYTFTIDIYHAHYVSHEKCHYHSKKRYSMDDFILTLPK